MVWGAIPHLDIGRFGIFTNIDLLRHDPSNILQLKQKDLRRENKRIGVGVGDTEEKSGECEEDILPVGFRKDGLLRCQGCSLPWVTTSPVNRLAVSEEAADLKKHLIMLQGLRPVKVI